MKRVLLPLALVMAAIEPVQAQIFKCTENGKSVFSDRPCAPDAAAMDVKPAAGGYNRLDDLRARSRTAQNEAELLKIDMDRAARRQATAREIDVKRQAEADRCKEIREKKQDAEYWAKEFRHPDNVQREQDKAKHWKERLWWECKQLD